MLPLLYPEIFEKFGIMPPRGVLFYGPPGTGKTLMARALASTCSQVLRKLLSLPKYWCREIDVSLVGSSSSCIILFDKLPSFTQSGGKVSFFMRKGADCLSKWVGEAERQLRLLFEQARQMQPSIIFFDEIDGNCSPLIQWHEPDLSTRNCPYMLIDLTSRSCTCAFQ